MMQRDTRHIAVVLSANPAAERLRQRLLEHGFAPASVTASLRGLRRSLVLGEYQRATLCITLDDATIDRHGNALRTLLDDQRSFATALTAIGITGRQPLASRAAALGCNVYVESLEHAVDAVCYFENSAAPVHPRCTGSWLQPLWMQQLSELRVGATTPRRDQDPDDKPDASSSPLTPD